MEEGREKRYRISIDKPEAVEDFYFNVFGWKVLLRNEDIGGTWWLNRIPESALDVGEKRIYRLQKEEIMARPENAGIETFAFIIEVEDLEQTKEKVVAFGGAVQFEIPAIEGGSSMVFFFDPAGNLFGAIQHPS